MLKYILGFILNLFNRGVSWLAQIDHVSKVSPKAKVYQRTKVFRSTMGDYSYMGRNSSLVCADIGKFCSIAGGATIGLGVHTLKYVSTSPIFTERCNGTGHSWIDKDVNNACYSRVTIGNDVWIGTKTIIMGGVTIGNGAVIGAGAIVTKNVPPYAIVGGVPAKVIRYRFTEDIIVRLQKIAWWNETDDKLKKYIALFQTDNITHELLDELESL